MRIIAGEYKGRQIKAPSGRDTRPTTDRVRESIFSSLISELGDLSGVCVLDMFAGSGAFGIEAISRGAAHAAFWDISPAAAGVVRDNLDALKIGPGRASVSVLDSLCTRTPYLPQKIDVVFADPPYATFAADVFAAVDRLAASGQLCAGALFVYEHATDADMALSSGTQARFEAVKNKRYGNTSVDFWRVG